MDTRGLMMLVVGSALMLSPVAIWLTSEPEAAVVTADATTAAPAAAVPAEAPPEVVADVAQTCTGAAIVSTSNRVNCDGQTVKDTSRRVTSGGAVFVSVAD
jgi:predicted dinucleotide-binding enzyme